MEPGIYQHYKGGYFLALTSATDEDSLATLVVYQALYDDYTVWVRTEADFIQHVSVPEYHYTGPRFRYIRTWTPEDTLSHPKSLIAFYQKPNQD